MAECPFSPEELSLIHWLSLGKSAEEVSLINEWSYLHTVYRIRLVRERIGAVNVTFLVAEALRNNWIE